ncbi:MAG: YihA family ribosome biogenesis GTP-binding protein [Candidatus Krumholzibacteriota bacterium]|nr:YihA family ribosome biogenesis GTP-binding protein [Candidatus Krumholzibacteriota bacterium]
MKIQSLNLVCTELEISRFPRSRQAEIAVCGRSNVGKSSLLNTLLGRRNIARVSKEPGKTRTINFFQVNEQFFLVDLPGYGYAKVSKAMRGGWQEMLFRYLEEREELRGVIQLIDSRHPPTRDDISMLQRLIDSERRFLAVFTKADKIKRAQRTQALDRFRSFFEGLSVGPWPPKAGEGEAESYDVPVLFFSSRTGEGKSSIWNWVSGLL